MVRQNAGVGGLARGLLLSTSGSFYYKIGEGVSKKLVFREVGLVLSLPLCLPLARYRTRAIASIWSPASACTCMRRMRELLR